jgi:Zn-dependent peptidase ImmA (M78 family)
VADVPINKEVLRWAIGEARISPSVLADRCGFDEDKVSSWLDGDELPNTGQVRQMAKRLGRSFQFFMLPEPPKSAPLNAQFRRSLHDSVPEPEKEATALRAAQRVQTVARWAVEDAAAEVSVPVRSQDESPAAYAARLRVALSWSMTVQRRQSSKSAVFRLLRERIENLGVIVLLQGAGAKSFRGFSLEEDLPIIFVNKDYKGAALRSFTLIHELAHLGSGTGGRSCYYDDTNPERWCNQVATEFLMPRQAFESYLDGIRVKFVTAENLEPLRLASNYFKASWLALAIRLTEIGRADDELVEFVKLNAVVEQDPSAPVPGIDRSTPVLRREEFGDSYVRVVRRAVEESRLSEVEAGRLLRSNAKQLGSLWQLTSGLK